MATSVLGDLKSVYHRTWWALMLRGVLGLVVGIYILARPLDSVAAFALVIAFWALFAGSGKRPAARMGEPLGFGKVERLMRAGRRRITHEREIYSTTTTWQLPIIWRS